MRKIKKEVIRVAVNRIRNLKGLDKEYLHIRAYEILLETLTDLGAQEVVDAYRQLEKETTYRLLNEAQQQRATAPDSTLEREDGDSPSFTSSTTTQNATLPDIVRRLKEIEPAMFLLIQAENSRDPSQSFLPLLRTALLAVQRYSSELEQHIPR